VVRNWVGKTEANHSNPLYYSKKRNLCDFLFGENLRMDILKTEFVYDPNNKFLQKTGYLKTQREPNKNGISIYEDRLILIITNSKYLESIEFYTHEFTEITLLKIFHEIAQEDNISSEGICWLNSTAHNISPFGENKASD